MTAAVAEPTCVEPTSAVVNVLEAVTSVTVPVNQPARCRNAVVTSLVELSNKAGVGAVGEPVKAGLESIALCCHDDQVPL